MQEVAKRAGVAPSSVSRVLSGHPNVSEVMKNRVIDAVAALGYEPDLLAQSLRRGASMTIGFVGIWLFSVLDRSPAAAKEREAFAAQKVRSETGYGATGASGH